VEVLLAIRCRFDAKYPPKDRGNYGRTQPEYFSDGALLWPKHLGVLKRKSISWDYTILHQYVGLIHFATVTPFDILQQLQGQVGLLFTDTEPEEVVEWFKDFRQADFARQGNIATRDVILPEGPIMQHHSDPPEPFPHNEEPQLRKLGLSTMMQKGVPTLQAPHTVCKKGKPLTSEQAQLLKLIGTKMAIFTVRLKSRWDSTTGQVSQIEWEDSSPEERIGGNTQAEGSESDGMSE